MIELSWFYYFLTWHSFEANLSYNKFTWKTNFHICHEIFRHSTTEMVPQTCERSSDIYLNCAMQLHKKQQLRHWSLLIVDFFSGGGPSINFLWGRIIRNPPTSPKPPDSHLNGCSDVRSIGKDRHGRSDVRSMGKDRQLKTKKLITSYMYCELKTVRF